MDVDTWKKRSSKPWVRSEGIQRIDRALQAWWTAGAWGRRDLLEALKEAIDSWVKTKGRRPDGSIHSERGPAVQELLDGVERDLRRRDILVALWSYNNQLGSRAPLYMKVTASRNAIKEVARRIQSAGIEPSQSIKGIFLAPEYFFTAPGAGEIADGLRVKRTVTAAQKKSFVEDFKGVSAGAKGILIVPGSVAWEEPANPSEYEQWKRLKQKLREVEDPARYKAPKANVMDGQVDLGDVVPRWDEKKQMVLSPGPKLIMHNTAIGLLDGAVRYEYDKHSDYHEAIHENLAPQRMVFLPGSGPGIKTIGGITFGFEICLDHHIGFLTDRAQGPFIGLSGVRAAPTIGREFHIVVSDSVGNSEAHMAVAKGGFFLHASTDPKLTSVWHKRDDGSPVKIEPDEKFSLGGSPLWFYRISQYPEEVKSPARAHVPEAWR